VQRSRRQLLFIVIGIVTIVASNYLSYELGGYRSGYSLLDFNRKTDELERTVANQASVIEELRRQQAILETSRDIDHETYAQVEANLKKQERKIQAQEEELAFYREIISPQDGVAGLKIQSLQIQPADSEQHHLLKLMLVQAIEHNKTVAGTVHVSVAGTLDHENAEFDLEQLAADGHAAELAYEFRYFQSFEQELVLPAGFEPDTVDVEIWPVEPHGKHMTQTFKWALVSG
jgi:Family of unknown function (DUF6776)